MVGLNHHTRHELYGFPTESYYITLICLEFHSRGGDGIGEAGDGHQGAGAGVFGDVVVEAQAGKQGRNGHQGHTGGGGSILLIQAQTGVDIDEKLAQGTDQSAHEECIAAILSHGGFGAHFLDQGFVLLFCHVDPSGNRMPGTEANMRNLQKIHK